MRAEMIQQGLGEGYELAPDDFVPSIVTHINDTYGGIEKYLAKDMGLRKLIIESDAEEILKLIIDHNHCSGSLQLLKIRDLLHRS